MSELQQKFDTLIQEQRALKVKFQQEAQLVFKGLFKEFFDKNPAVNAIKWSQYTPYFNDGDTCVFSVNDPHFTNAEGEELDNVTTYGEYIGEDESIWCAYNVGMVMDTSKNYWEAERNKIIASGKVIDAQTCNALSDMIMSTEMEEVMENMFGDHVIVVATRDGFDVEEYEHD